MINSLIIIALIVLTLFNYYYLQYFKSRTKNGLKIEETDNYYRLDAKIEFQKYLAIGFISIGTLFGISKFSDLSSEFKKFEDLDLKYTQLSTNYQKLLSENMELTDNMKEMKDIYLKFQVEKKDMEIEFVKQDQKIKEATQRIPENNIKLVSKLLVRSHLEYYASVGRLGIGYENQEVIEELNKMRPLLSNIGFNDEEIGEIFGDISNRIPWIFKKE